MNQDSKDVEMCFICLQKMKFPSIVLCFNKHMVCVDCYQKTQQNFDRNGSFQVCSFCRQPLQFQLQIKQVSTEYERHVNNIFSFEFRNKTENSAMKIQNQIYMYKTLRRNFDNVKNQIFTQLTDIQKQYDPNHPLFNRTHFIIKYLYKLNYFMILDNQFPNGQVNVYIMTKQCFRRFERLFYCENDDLATEYMNTKKFKILFNKINQDVLLTNENQNNQPDEQETNLQINNTDRSLQIVSSPVQPFQQSANAQEQTNTEMLI